MRRAALNFNNDDQREERLPALGHGHTGRRASRATIILPWPPTTNHIWQSAVINGRTRTYRSKRYKDFLTRAAVAVQENIMKGTYCGHNYYETDFWDGRKLEGDNIDVSLVYYAPDRRRYDVDNRIKAVLDALTHFGVWDDDSQVRTISARKSEVDKKHPRVLIGLMQYPTDEPDEDNYPTLEGFGKFNE